MAISIDGHVGRSFIIRGHHEDEGFGSEIRWVLTARCGERKDDDSHIHFCGLVTFKDEQFTIKDKSDIKTWAQMELNAKSCSFERATQDGWRKSYFKGNNNG